MTTMLVAGGDGGNIATSPDGITWTSRTNPFTGFIFTIRWVEDLGLFVAVGHSGKVATSPDGVTWTEQTTPVTFSLQDFAWSAPLGLLVATGNDGIITSPDAVTWTEVTDAFATGNIIGVAWGDGLFVTGRLFPSVLGAHSTDGTTWTTTSADGAGRKYAWSDDAGLFVLGSSADDEVRTSPDGITWTSRTAPIGNVGRVRWIDSQSLFVLVGQGSPSGSTSRFMSSPDGITWTAHTPPGGNNLLNDVFYSDDLGLWFTVAGPNSLYTSSDASSWTKQTSPFGTNAIRTIDGFGPAAPTGRGWVVGSITFN